MPQVTHPSSLTLKQLPNCPVCGLKSVPTIYDLGDIKISECHDCGLHFLNPCLEASSMARLYETSQTLSEVRPLLDSYYQYGSLNNKSATLSEMTRTLERAEKYLASGGRKLLEIGAGNGWFVALAQSRGWQATGLDSSQHNVAEAKTRFGVDLICNWFEEFTCAPESFDAIVLRDVLEHRDDPVDFLRQAMGLLRKGGLLITSVPNRASALVDLSRFLYRATLGRFTLGLRKWYVLEHTAYYATTTLKRLLRRIGLEPLDCFGTNTDLARYRLPLLQKIMGYTMLWLGTLVGRQTRVTVLARKP